MKTGFTLMMGLMAGLAAAAMAASEQNARAHRVAFEFVADAAKQQESLLNNIENVLKALGGETEIIVIAHGEGLALLKRRDDDVVRRMKDLSGQQVTFVACENTMRRKNVSKDDLVPFAKTVDSGVAEVVRRQSAGWSYVKSGG